MPAAPNRSPPRLPELSFTVAAEATERLDRFLADQLGLSRTQAARLVAQKAVDVEGKTARASRLLARGERVTVRIPDHEPPRTLQPATIALTVVYEDEHLAVIDKPAGQLVHPTSVVRGGTVSELAVARWGALPAPQTNSKNSSPVRESSRTAFRLRA